MSDAPIKNKKTATGADVYEGLHGSTQTFPGIGIMEAVNGNVVLRGRNGMRDHIFKLQDAVTKYEHALQMVHSYARYGVRGWDTLKDLADDLLARIKEAADQRIKLHEEIPQPVKDFLHAHDWNNQL